MAKTKAQLLEEINELRANVMSMAQDLSRADDKREELRTQIEGWRDLYARATERCNELKKRIGISKMPGDNQELPPASGTLH